MSLTVSLSSNFLYVYNKTMTQRVSGFAEILNITDNPNVGTVCVNVIGLGDFYLPQFNGSNYGNDWTYSQIISALADNFNTNWALYPTATD